MERFKEKYRNYNKDSEMYSKMLVLVYVADKYHYRYDIIDNGYIKGALSIYNEFDKIDIIKYQKSMNKEYKKLINYYEGLNDLYIKENYKI